MAKTKEQTKHEQENLPATLGPPSLLAAAAPPDEVSAAFGGALQTQPERRELPVLPLARIDHKEGCFIHNGNPVEFLEGYPIHWFQARGYWDKPYKSGQSEPPVCFSVDMVKPSETSPHPQARNCSECKMSKFGSAPVGGGQACKVNTFVFLVNPEFGSPPVVCMILPPSSIKALIGGGRKPGYLPLAKHFKDPRTGRVANYHELVWSRFGLQPGGDLHYVVDPHAVSVCANAAEATALAKMRETFFAAFENLRGESATAVMSGEDGAA